MSIHHVLRQKYWHFLLIWALENIFRPDDFVNYVVKYPFAGYDEKLPFVKPAPIDQEESKKSKKHKEAQKKKEKNVAEGVKSMDLNNWAC